MNQHNIMKKIKKINIDQAKHGGSVYIENNAFANYDVPVKILGDKINEIIDFLNKLDDNSLEFHKD